MGNIKNIYFDWNKAGSCQVRQYDHLSNRVIFGNAPKFENYYLLVAMKESESDEQAKEMSPILLTSPVWLIPNSYTQMVQQIKFQICNQGADGTFEQHSAEYTIDVLKSHDHEGEAIDVDPSPMYDAYKEYVDDRIEELIDEAGGISVDTREYVDEKIQTMIAAAGDVAIDTTLSVSGAAADAKATGDAISETNGRLQEYEDIFTGDVGESVSNWLDEHPEATTTVEDESLTEAKFTDALKLKTIKEYVTPEMYGAVGDGTNDDTSAIVSALATGKIVLLNGTYKCTSNITLSGYACLMGTGVNRAKIVFDGDYGFVIAGRHITVTGMTIKGNGIDGVGTGFDATADASTYRLILTDLIIEDFANGVYFGSVTWNCTFTDIRFNRCGYGIRTTSTGASGMTVTFINLHFNHCNRCASIYGFKCTFISCNFGVDKFTALIIGNVSGVTFINCNFECDQKVTDATGLISCSGRSVQFIQCMFKINAGENSRIFDVYNGTQELSFKGCHYSKASENSMPDRNFYSIGQSNTSNYGAIIFDGGNQSIPRPVYNERQRPNWVDRERGIPLSFFTTTISKDKLFTGELLYSIENSCICMYDGANVVKVSDGTVIV